jgi:ABC-2 type transport system ATP-binding protein
MLNAGLAVETSGLTKRYPRPRRVTDALRGRPVEEKPALTDVTLTIEQGEVFGLLGPNGSGKTTLLKLLSTILSPTAGSARIFGHDVAREPRAVRQRVALVTGEERSLYWRLTGRQNLLFFVRLYGLDGRRMRGKIDELLDLFQLKEAADSRVGEYSTGMRQKLAIARGLLSEPKLLFLDEPTRGLDPVAAHSLLKLVRERAVEHFDNTVILTTHIAREVEQLCTRIATLNHGRISFLGRLEDLGSSLHRCDVYTLTVAGLSDGVFERLRTRTGVEQCTRSLAQDGLTEIEIAFARGATNLSDVLRHLLLNNVEIVRCAVKEHSLEETFRVVFDHRFAEASGAALR